MSQKNITDTFVSLRGALARVVSGIVPPREIEDIVQETYVRACQAERNSEIRTPRSFLYRTARNLAIDYTKRAETRLTSDQVLAEDAWDETQSPEDQTFHKVCSDEEFVMFCDAVRLLPTECRRSFVLKKVYGYSQREIAEELGLSQSAVEKHVAQGVRRCTQYMLERENGTSTQPRKNTQAAPSHLKPVQSEAKNELRY